MRIKLNPIHQKIWELALSYQDKRNDEGHAEIATGYALELLGMWLDADGFIVIPAIILHDIGWSQMPADKLMIVYNPPSKEAEYTARLEHQIYALPLTVKILREVSYDPNLIPKILLIISQHDTRKGYWTISDAIVRDADKLWRYSQRHLEIAAKNKGWTTKKEAEDFLTNVTVKKIDEPGFFMTEEARQIARRDIRKLVIPEWLE